MVGVIVITFLSSISTVMVSNMWVLAPASNQVVQSDITSLSNDITALNEPASIMDCGEYVFSPIQKNCVKREVFDAEMNKLFAALGLDIKPYK